MPTLRNTIVGRIDEQVLAYTALADMALDRRLVDVDCIGTAAHVTMLSRMPLAKPPVSVTGARKVIRELVTIMRAARSGDFAITLDDQDVHMAVERCLTARLGNLGKRVHTARSRNDQVAVDLRLHAKEQLFVIADEVARLAGALVGLAAAHARVPMVGRTHLQPAMPSSVGLWAGAHAESLVDDLALLERVAELNDRCPLGSAASYGVPLPIDRALTARLLGFAGVLGNVLYAGNTRGKNEATLLAGLAQVMITLSRLAEDLILFAMPEFGYFRLPSGSGTGSSIMPQKNNPDVLELMRARSARVLAAASCAAEITRGLPSGYNRDAQETKALLLEGLDTTRDSLIILVPLIEGLTVQRDALIKAFTPDVFATDRALELVAAGTPFRDAYAYVKANPGELMSRDPVAAIARKRHVGGTANLGLKEVRAQLRGATARNRRRREAYRRAVSRLLGVSYPELKGRRA